MADEKLCSTGKWRRRRAGLVREPVTSLKEEFEALAKEYDKLAASADDQELNLK